MEAFLKPKKAEKTGASSPVPRSPPNKKARKSYNEDSEDEAAIEWSSSPVRAPKKTGQAGPIKRLRADQPKSYGDHDGAPLEADDINPTLAKDVDSEPDAAYFDEKSPEIDGPANTSDDLQKDLEKWHAQHSVDQSDPAVAAEFVRRAGVTRGRLEHALSTLIRGANRTSPDQLTQTEKPMSVGWWWFLTRVDLATALDMYMSKMPEKAVWALGSKGLDRDALLSLPEYNKANIFHGVYLDIVTGDHVSSLDGYEPYCGSATGQEGLKQRLEKYILANKNGKITESGRHLDLIKKEGSVINLRVVGGFNPADMGNPYVLLFEQMISSITGCFEKAKTSE